MKLLERAIVFTNTKNRTIITSLSLVKTQLPLNLILKNGTFFYCCYSY